MTDQHLTTLLLSADIVSSTAFQSSRPPEEWVPVFDEFFTRCIDLVLRKTSCIRSARSGFLGRGKLTPLSVQ